MVEGSKQVRIDNWGIFFLQRLQMFFSKTDYCDLTLQFEGNVQLKVHRLVINACTEYFTILEQSYPALEENTIMMPAALQADVIVPIVNFMYTGMLEFHMSNFDKLYNAAALMNLTVLTKLLDAQKVPPQPYKPTKKKGDVPHTWNLQGKKISAKTTSTPDLPAPLPGRKLPIWKRKNLPTQHPTSQMNFTETRYPPDPLLLHDNSPKPTRFEWPEDDLPPVNLMDTSFDEISYTSRPLLTQQEEVRASTSFDEIKNNVNGHPKKGGAKKKSGSIDIKDVEEYVKEQKIRGDLTSLDEGLEEYDFGRKRKLSENSQKTSPKRMKANDKENKETTISIKGNHSTELDHTKIVSEILKKYPDLVKKNKNIRLKIMADGNKAITEDKVKVHPKVKTPKLKVQEEVITKAKAVKSAPEKSKDTLMFDTEGPWTCSKCTEEGELPQEFVLYYLYRKHMTDVHNEVFDVRLCKYCGRRCSKHNLMMYHLYTKHGLKPPASYNFPKCNLCPYIALSTQKLAQHKKHHDSKEMQCQECKLAFTSQQTLTAHIQIMGHCTKPGKPSYDCQYCTKKLHSAINLFSHIKNSHLKEAKKDGMVSLDEMDENDDMENEEEEEEEYILPEAPSEVAIQKDKVKIISNVKVPANVQQGRVNAQARPVPLEPSSEAEALTNVASGIATSLGLVDIVVLDENQQYITLQQENQSGQSEFILPELQSNEGSFAGQVITTQHNTVLPQGMLQSASQDIGSTDELVMVLTDHDYQDEQEGATDNSNIVVLYSHPVDGQQGQFITSQGNLLVNSHTGMLEIRNGATIATTTASQMVVNSAVDAPIESIEMIQREIDGHGELKPEPFYEEEPKPEVDQEYRESDQAKESEVQQEPHQDQEQYHEEQEDSEVGVIETEQNVSDENTTIEYQESNEESQHYVHTENSEEQIVQEDTQNEVKKDTIDGVETVYEEPMEVEESEETVQEDAADKETAVVNEEQPKDEILTPQETEQEETETKSKSEKDQVSREETGVDLPPELDRISEHEESGTLVLNDPSSIFISHDADSCKEESIKEDVPEAMEVDGKQQMEADEKEVEVESQEGAEIEEVDGQHEKVVSEGGVTKPAEPQSSQEVASHSIEYQHQSETSNSQYNDDDENSQSSQGTAQSQENTIDSQSNINQTILEDWEDTDSQQSEKQRVAMKEAAENVNKLMDDWEEEDDEEDKREGN